MTMTETVTFNHTDLFPIPGPNVLSKELKSPEVNNNEARQPDKSKLKVTQIYWGEEKGNSIEEVNETIYWARMSCYKELKNGFRWGANVLVHGRKSSYLNLLPEVDGECPLPELGDTVICIGNNKFQYRPDKWEVIHIKQDPSQLKKRFKVATLSKFNQGGVLLCKEVPFTGMIQNLLINYREEVADFFKG